VRVREEPSGRPKGTLPVARDKLGKAATWAGELRPIAYLYFLPVWDDYNPEAGLMHINELKFSVYGGAACYQPERLAEQSLNSMQLQHQQQQAATGTPVEKLLLLLKQ